MNNTFVANQSILEFVKNSLEEPDEYLGKVDKTLKDIQAKIKSIEDLMEKNKKLMFATWLYKLKRRNNIGLLDKPTHYSEKTPLTNVDKTPLVFILSISVCVILVVISLIKSSLAGVMN